MRRRNVTGEGGWFDRLHPVDLMWPEMCNGTTYVERHANAGCVSNLTTTMCCTKSIHIWSGDCLVGFIIVVFAAVQWAKQSIPNAPTELEACNEQLCRPSTKKCKMYLQNWWCSKSCNYPALMALCFLLLFVRLFGVELRFERVDSVLDFFLWCNDANWR